MIPGTLQRYFAWLFLGSVATVFGGIYLLISLVDYVEMTKRAANAGHVTGWTVALASFYRVPLHAERILPFAVLIATMSCYLGLSRRLELVVARSAGMSAWQFVSPAVYAALAIGVFATTVYNPVSAIMQERAKEIEATIFGDQAANAAIAAGGLWARQRSGDGQSIIHANTSREQGAVLDGVTALVFEASGGFRHRIHAKTAVLEKGNWRLSDARIFATGLPAKEYASYLLGTNLTAEQVRESFATPETLPFYEIPAYIEKAENAGLVAAGYRLQYQKLLARPFFLAAIVLLAAAVSLRFFRIGGVQKMILSGVASGFLLYVLSKVADDLSTARLMHPVAAAWLPVFAGGLSGFIALLYQEDG
ncbi:MAG: LPS export ABC transporter permease LptG [Proteobacteria bacterium]|nr:LPS export ABC transporter permease LptG [Pseudomonadota bacterium]